MKKRYLIGLLALVTALALGFVGCDSGGSSDGDSLADLVLLQRTDSGREIETTISGSGRNVQMLQPVEGGIYNYVIRWADTREEISRGKMEYDGFYMVFKPSDGSPDFTGTYTGGSMKVDIPLSDGTKAGVGSGGGGSVGVGSGSSNKCECIDIDTCVTECNDGAEGCSESGGACGHRVCVFGSGKHVEADCEEHYKCMSGYGNDAKHTPCVVCEVAPCADGYVAAEHATAPCGVAAHKICEASYEAADHGVCALCQARLCNGENHGSGQCDGP